MLNATVSDTTTRGIRVRTTSQFLEERSNPSERQFLFGYRIHIQNTGDRQVQLLARHWIIIDADGNRQDVSGEGVVGEKPQIAPDDSYDYSSFCPLATPWGTMEGSYRMRDSTGEEFEVEIARFCLVAKDHVVAEA